MGHNGAMRTSLPTLLAGWPARALACAMALLCCTAMAQAPVPPPAVHTAQALRALHDSMAEGLRAGKFHLPLRLDSLDTASGVRGDVYAELDADFEQLSRALSDPGHWCDVLLLHVNNRRCRVLPGAAGAAPTLVLGIVRKYDHAPDQAMRLALAYKQLAASSDYFEVELSSPDGPMGTSNFHITVQAVALPGRHTFVHFKNAYDAGLLASMATKAFLATFSADKVGFTVVGKLANGQPDHMRGARGLMERNVMRYFLGIQAYVQALGAPVDQQFERRLDAWTTLAEHYPRQLHEVDKATYLALKRADRARDDSAWR